MKPQSFGETERINCRPSPALIGRPSRERVLGCVLRYAREGAVVALLFLFVLDSVRLHRK